MYTTARCRTISVSRFKHLNYVRDLPALPVEERFGELDGAPIATPSETLLAALGSCLSARIQANAAAGSIAIHSLELDVEVDVTPTSMWDPPSQQPRPIGFEAIRVAVHLKADAPPQALRALIAHALLWSPVANTLHDPVEIDVTLSAPIAAP